MDAASCGADRPPVGREAAVDSPSGWRMADGGWGLKLHLLSWVGASQHEGGKSHQTIGKPQGLWVGTLKAVLRKPHWQLEASLP